jgi:uncharacterized protein (TIGR02301 family)
MIAVAMIAAGGSPKAQAPAPEAAPEADSSLPYEAEMQRLSEIMGALHFLDQLCGEAGSSPWRDEMTALLEAEQPAADRRARMVDSFNRGYESYRSVYRTCEDSAEIAMQRYHDEGVRIATDIGSRYGGQDGQ